MRFAGSKIANLLGDKPNYDEIGSQGTMESALGAANTALNNAKAADAVMRSEAEILAAEANADAIAAQGQAQATASMANSIGSAVGGLFGAAQQGGHIFNTTPSFDSYDDIPSIGSRGLEANSYIGTGGKYGSFTPFNATY